MGTSQNRHGHQAMRGSSACKGAHPAVCGQPSIRANPLPRPKATDLKSPIGSCPSTRWKMRPTFSRKISRNAAFPARRDPLPRSRQGQLGHRACFDVSLPSRKPSGSVSFLRGISGFRSFRRIESVRRIGKTVDCLGRPSRASGERKRGRRRPPLHGHVRAYSPKSPQAASISRSISSSSFLGQLFFVTVNEMKTLFGLPIASATTGKASLSRPFSSAP